MGILGLVLVMGAGAAQGGVPAGNLPVLTAPPVQVASPQAPLNILMHPSVMPPPARVYAPPPVFVPAANPHIPRPMGYADGWVTTADYPKEALKAEQTGFVVVSLTVAPTGRVSGCAVTLSSGFPLLDAATCRLLAARGLFTPATDEAGNPTTGTWAQRVKWAMPNVLPYPPRASWLDLKITVEADGTQSHCEVSRSEGQLSTQFAHLGPFPCSGQKTRPYTDAAGRPVRRVVTVTQAVTVTDEAP